MTPEDRINVIKTFAENRHIARKEHSWRLDETFEDDMKWATTMVDKYFCGRFNEMRKV
jgi:hypothetical protein